MNEVDKKMVKQALNNISGRQGNPLLRWHLEREDGSFDGSDGMIHPEADLLGKQGMLVFIEELHTSEQGKNGFRGIRPVKQEEKKIGSKINS